MAKTAMTYLTILSDAPLDLYPDISTFQVRLPRPVEILQGAWEVGLCELAYPRPIFLYCDVIGPKLVGNTLAHCLHTIQYPSPAGHHVFDVYYVPVEKTDFRQSP